MRSGSGTRTRDTAIMSRLLYHLSYPALAKARAPMRIRTADLLLTMETLYLLSYRGRWTPPPGDTDAQRYTLRDGPG